VPAVLGRGQFPVLGVAARDRLDPLVGAELFATPLPGDTKHWELTPTQNRRHLFVKPVYEQAETSMTVITDKRSYQFVLRSTGPGSKWYQRVTWRYGETLLLDARAEEERAQVTAAAERAADQERRDQNVGAGIRPQDLRFDYTLEGDSGHCRCSMMAPSPGCACHRSWPNCPRCSARGRAVSSRSSTTWSGATTCWHSA
jgi:hypothetical protein